jgi:rubrerythrin
MQSEKSTVDHGTTIYDEDGTELGTVRGFDEHGFYVTAVDDIELLPDETLSSDNTEAVMWRCWECGEMGEIANLPEECPSCGASKEELYYWQED